MRHPLSALFALCLAFNAGCDKSAEPENKASAESAKKTTPVAKKKVAPSSQPSSQPVKKAAPASQPIAAPAAASVHFVFPNEGSRVFEDFDAVFAGGNINVSPAGKPVTVTGSVVSGHHHIVVDGKSVAKGTPVAANETHIHYGKAQTQTRLKLAPGKHTLTMQFADLNHVSYGADLSSTVNIEVVPNPAKTPRVFFDGLVDGAKVKSPLKVKFGLEGMTILPAGKNPADKTSGHHHVIVDGKPTPIGAGVAADKTHIHFGKGQTETELTLATGKHTLTLQFADGAHRSYGKALSATITVEVE